LTVCRRLPRLFAGRYALPRQSADVQEGRGRRVARPRSAYECKRD